MVAVVKVFTLTIPQKDQLSCVICRSINCENDPVIYSRFCESKLKCRRFLQETPQAMAAPVVNRKIREAGGFMYAIVAKEFFDSCTFRNHCGTLNIQMMDLLEPVPTYVYRACLLYTLEYKLAPRWNKVGPYLVEGQDFLSSAGPVSAITLKIKEIHGNDFYGMIRFIDDGERNNAVLHVNAVNLKIPFLRSNTTHRLQHDLQPPVRVLPSMQLANVLRISKIIKSHHVLDYDGLRAYWRNMHGYVLPDYEEGLLFYNIQFFYFKSSVFLYPETCLTSGPLEILPPPIDPTYRIYKFAEELRERVTELCGQRLDVCPENACQASTCTPILSRANRFSTGDTGYGTGSEGIWSTARFRTPDTCEIPAKRSRVSLPRADEFFTRGIDIDYDFGISPMCSRNGFKSPETPDDISTIPCNADSTVSGKPIAKRNETRSSYFTQEETEVGSTSTDKERKPDNSTLKEKLLRNFKNC